VLGRILGELGRSTGGQLLLELPDELRPSLLGNILSGANEGFPDDMPYAIVAHDARKDDLAHLAPNCDFRELAAYREGERLVIVYESDNRGMSTYTSVFQPMFSVGFPGGSGQLSSAGIATATDIFKQAATHLGSKHRLSGEIANSFQQSVLVAGNLLTDAYLKAGNGKIGISANWWTHVQTWFECLDVALADLPSGISPAMACHGSAGIPVPADPKNGYSDKFTGETYLKVLRARWGSPEEIRTEISRFEFVPTAMTAWGQLKEINWEEEFEESIFELDSPITRVALAGKAGHARVVGWANLTEIDFLETYQEAPRGLMIYRDGNELPLPWKGAPAVLVLSPEEDNCGEGPEITLESFGVVIPWRDGKDPVVPSEEALHGIVLKAEGDGSIYLESISASIRKPGLLVKGMARIVLPAKQPTQLRLQAKIPAGLTELVDIAKGSVHVVRSNQAAVFLKPVSARARKSDQRGPCVIGMDLPFGPTEVRISLVGRYLVEVAVGRQGQPSTSIAGVELVNGWPGGVTDPRLSHGEIDLISEEEITINGKAICRIVIDRPENRPLSPVVAAALGIDPSTDADVKTGLLGALELKILRSKSLDPDFLGAVGLGCVLGLASRSRVQLQELKPGIQVAGPLADKIGNLDPGLPSDALLLSPEYVRLVVAYRKLGIPARIHRVEAEAESFDLGLSRLSLGFIPQECIEELLDAYVGLLDASSSMSPCNRFWARYPFSIAIFLDEPGFQACHTILLSPLHPLRISWLWALEVGLRSTYEDSGSQVNSFRILDPTVFPAVGSHVNGFGSNMHFASVPIDSAPAGVNMGWHALVHASDIGPLKVPEWLNGGRFPVTGLSGLSAGAVSSAISDFLRVSPHVQVLEVELSSPTPCNRSQGVDEGIRDMVANLARTSHSLEGVGGIRVFDSKNRLGMSPSLDLLREDLVLARAGFNVEWRVSKEGHHEGAHVNVMEGSAAAITVNDSGASSEGWLPEVPLRRFPRRIRRDGSIGLDYSLSVPESGAPFMLAALHAAETNHSGKALVTWIKPNIAALPSRPEWLVTGDFGIDPGSISEACRRTIPESGYMLWDWRPAATVVGKGEVGARTQPYFILAALPDALASALREKVEKLSPGIAPEGIKARVDEVVKTLSEKAIGLNSLLAIGHHQATGALGFFFALKALAQWMLDVREDELRLVIPVDAVDPLLRNLTEGGIADTLDRRRADLLAVRVTTCTGILSIGMCPIEIKHYGLSNGEGAASFPSSGEARLKEHLQQLTQYAGQLEVLQERYARATGSEASLLSQQVAIVIESALQLSPHGSHPKSASMLKGIVEGKAELSLASGILLWYQAGAGDTWNASWDDIPHGDFPRHMFVKVDPRACNEEIWGSENGAACQVVSEALAASLGIQQVPVVASGEDVATTSSSSVGEVAPPETWGTDPSKRVVPPSPVVPTPRAPLETSPEMRPRKKLPREELEKRYERILGALAEFKVKVHRPDKSVVPYTEGPATIEFSVDPGFGVAVSKIEGQLENVKLRLKLPESAILGCRTHKGYVLISIPKDDKERYFVSTSEIWKRWERPAKGFRIPLGEDIVGELVSIEFSDPNSPHVLIAGVTGSGKSEALLALLQGATKFYSPEELRLKLIDPKGTELVSLEDSLHLDGEIGWSAGEAIQLLEDAANEMDRRYELFVSSKSKDIDDYNTKGLSKMPRWLIVLDEYADLTSDDAERKDIEKRLKRLAQKARAAGIHLVVSTQKPVVTILNTVVKGNLPGRIALRVNSSMESKVILDDTGAEKLTGKGDALLKIGSSTIRLQFAKHDA
jgi:hypothetical protein